MRRSTRPSLSWGERTTSTQPLAIALKGMSARPGGGFCAILIPPTLTGSPMRRPEAGWDQSRSRRASTNSYTAPGSIAVRGMSVGFLALVAVRIPGVLTAVKCVAAGL